MLPRMIYEEDPVVVEEVPAAVEEEDVFEDVEADFAEPDPAGTYVLSTRRRVVSGQP